MEGRAVIVMRRSIILSLFLMVLLISTAATAFKTELVAGTITGDKVYHDFGDAYIEINPEKARSRFGTYEQTVTVTNKGLTDLYYWIDPYYDQSMDNIEIFDISYRTLERPLYDVTCSNSTQLNGSTNEYCTSELIGTEYEELRELTKVEGAIPKGWGKAFHYVQTGSTLVKAGGSHQWLVRYKPRKDTGKWNARVWADTVDDWECILDDRLDCEYSYVVDPTWWRNPSTDGVQMYWSFDDSNTTPPTTFDLHSTHDGTIHDTVTDGVAGVVDEAFDFDGIDGRVEDATGIITPDTLSFWFNPDADITTSTLKGVVGGDETSVQSIQLGGSWTNRFADEIVTLPTGAANTEYYWTSTGLDIEQFESGVWYQMAFVWVSASTNYRLYINGTDMGLGTKEASPAQVSYAALNIGQGLSVFFDGQMDEIGLWNESLNSSEMASLYNSGAGFQYDFNETVADPAIINYTLFFTDGVYETSISQFNITFEHDNGTTISTVNITHNNTLSNMLLLSSNITHSDYGVNITMPLIELNDTSVPFNITYRTLFSNGTNVTNTSSTSAHNITWAFYPTQIISASTVFETQIYNVTVNVTRRLNQTDLTLTNTLTWNHTNYTETVYTNDTTSSLFTHQVTVPLVDALSLINMSTYFNVTWNGTMYNRTLIHNASTSVYLAYFPIDIIAAANATESSSVTVYTNNSRLYTASNDATWESILQYDGVNYSSTSYVNDSSNSSMLFTHSLTAPSVANDTLIDIKSWLQVLFGGAGINRTNTTVYTNQTIIAINASICNSTETPFLNFTIYDDTTLDRVISDFDGFFEVTVLSTNITEEFNISLNSSSTYEICFSPINESINVSAQIEYGSLPTYPTKTYYIDGANLSTNTTFIDLYLTANSTQVALKVVDQDDTAIEGAFIQVLSYDLATDSFVVSEIVKTDFNGVAYAEMTLFTQFYRFIILVNGEIELSTTETKIVTTSLTFRINLGTDYFENYAIVRDVSCGVTFDNSTNEFSLTFANSVGTAVNVFFEVEEFSLFLDQIVNSTSVNSSGGVLTLGIGTPNNSSYVARGSVLIDGQSFSCGALTRSFGSEHSIFGLTGIYLTMMLVFVLGMIGLWSPLASIVLSMLGLFMATVFGFFALQVSTIVILIVMAGIAIWRVNRR